MVRKMLSTVILLIAVPVIASEPHRVPANSHGNRLILAVVNRGTETVEAMKLTVEDSPAYVRFDPRELLVAPLSAGESKDVVLEFSVDRVAPVGNVDSVIIAVKFGGGMRRKVISLTYVAPSTFQLEQDYPNPFNPSTTIRYQLPTDAWVTLTIYDVLGREVERLVDERKEAGYHESIWKSEDAASGLYFYRLSVRGQDGFTFTDTKKMLLLR